MFMRGHSARDSIMPRNDKSKYIDTNCFVKFYFHGGQVSIELRELASTTIYLHIYMPDHVGLVSQWKEEAICG
jgi:hypothetical protein